MGKKQKAAITVTIYGEKGSGLTTTLNAIGAALQGHGFNVVCRDDIGVEVSPGVFSRRSLDDRLIEVATKTV